MSFKISTIGKYCKVGDGAHASIQRQDFGKLYLSAKNFTKDGLSLDSVSYISEDDFNKYFNPNSKALTKPKRDDLILGIIGAGLGIPYLIDDSVDEFGISSSVAIIRPDNVDIDSKYLYYWMVGSVFQRQLKNIQSGSAQGFLSLEMIRSLPLSFPKIKIQKKIASILSAYDKLIENNNHRITLLEQMAEEIYKEWFVRFRFSHYENTPIVDGLPEGWEKVKVKDAFEIFGGGTPSKEISAYWDGGTIEWVTPSDITSSEGLFIYSSSDKITELGLSKSSAKVFPPFSVMMTSRATIGAVGINVKEASTNQGFITCLPNKFFPYTYILNWIKENKGLIDNHASGATFKEISKSVFKGLDILKVEEEVVCEFHNRVEPLYQLINTLLQKNQSLKQTRDLLLPRLMSGKLSVEHLLKQKEQQLQLAI